MRKHCIVLIALCLTLFFVVGLNMPFLKNRPVYGELVQNNINASQQQRLGTNNILYFPDDVRLISGNRQNSSLSQQFILLGNNSGTYTNRNTIAAANPDYGLPTSIPLLNNGDNFIIVSTTDSDIVYRSADVTLVPITSPFPPPNTRIEDVDPENDISLSRPINLGNYTGNLGTFAIPSTASPGNYLLYLYLKYPTYNMTVVYNTALKVKSSEGTTIATAPG
jgi:hypothetical protein